MKILNFLCQRCTIEGANKHEYFDEAIKIDQKEPNKLLMSLLRENEQDMQRRVLELTGDLSPTLTTPRVNVYEPTKPDDIKIEGILEFMRHSQTGESFKFQYCED